MACPTLSFILSWLRLIHCRNLKWHRELPLILARWAFGGHWQLILGLCEHPVFRLAATSHAFTSYLFFSSAERRFRIPVGTKLCWSSLPQILDFRNLGSHGLISENSWMPNVTSSEALIFYIIKCAPRSPRRGSRLHSSRPERGVCEPSTHTGGS